MKPGRQAGLALALTALMLVAWSGVLHLLPVRAHLAESNYHSNLIRLEDALAGDPAPLALLGSSMTGRLLPTHFAGTAVTRIANLGLDGAGPLLGLELLAGRSNVPPVAVVEANLLMVPEGPNDRALRDAVDGFGFRLAKYFAIFRAESRPSSLIYAWLKRQKDARSVESSQPGGAAGTPGIGRSEQEIRLDRNTPEELAANKARVYELFRRLQARGIRLVLVRFPISTSVVQTSFHPLDFTGDLAKEFNIRRVDLGQEMRARGHEPRFTDGTHLGTASARQAAAIIAEVALTQPQ